MTTRFVYVLLSELFLVFVSLVNSLLHYKGSGSNSNIL